MPARLTISRASYSKNLKPRSRVGSGAAGAYTAASARRSPGRQAISQQQGHPRVAQPARGPRAPTVRRSAHVVPAVDVACRPALGADGKGRDAMPALVIAREDHHGLLLETRMAGPCRAVVLAGGEVDLESSPRLREAIDEALRQYDTVHVDLRAVTFLDSTGIATLLGAAESARRSDIALTLQVSRVVRRVLELA